MCGSLCLWQVAPKMTSDDFESAKTVHRRLKIRLFAKKKCQENGMILQQTLSEARNI